MNVFTPAADLFRFYEDGTESGSTPLAAEDTNATVIVDSDVIAHLRYRVQETGGADGATTDDWAIQFSRNGGAFTAIDIGSFLQRPGLGSGLTNGAATTQRLTAGTGSFVAGEQEENNANSVILNHQLTSSNHTEHVWAILLIAADLVDGDIIDFRMTLNGGAPGMTNSVTPRITVQKTPAQADVVHAIANQTTTSTSYVRVPGMALAPQTAGAKVALVIIEVNGGGVSNQTIDVQLHKNGTAVGGADTASIEIDATYGPLTASEPDLGYKAVIVKKLTGLVTTDTIDVKWKTSTGTAGVSSRTLHLIPVANADDIIVGELTNTVPIDTNGAWLTSITLGTPGAGTYVALQVVGMQRSAATEDTVNNESGIHVSDVLVARTLRNFFLDSSSAVEAWCHFAAAVLTLSASDTVKMRLRTATGVANGINVLHRAIILIRVSSSQVVEKSATATTTRNVDTYATLDSMTETIDGTGDPGQGDYDVIFSGNSGGPASAADRYTLFGLHVAGSLQTDVQNTHYHEASHDAVRHQAIGMSHFLAITSGQTVDVRWRSTDTTLQSEFYERSLIFWSRAAPAAAADWLPPRTSPGQFARLRR